MANNQIARLAIIIARITAVALALTALTIHARAQENSATAQQAAVDELIHEQVIVGDANGGVQPISSTLSQRAYLVMLARTLHLTLPKAPSPAPSPGASPASTEMSTESTLAPRVSSQEAKSVAEQYGITTPLATGDPVERIDREEAAVLTMNAANIAHVIRYGSLPAEFPLFADEDQIAPDARDAAHQAVFFGLLEVGPDNMFYPRQKVTFGKSAIVMKKLSSLYQARDQASF